MFQLPCLVLLDIGVHLMASVGVLGIHKYMYDLVGPIHKLNNSLGPYSRTIGRVAAACMSPSP